MYLDIILEKLGSFGKYQRIVTIIALSNGMLQLCNFCLMVFAGCNGPDPEGISNGNVSTQFYSICLEWDTVNDYTASIITTSQMAGFLIGTIPGGHLCDGYGRKAIWIFGVVGMSASGLMSSLSPTWHALAAFKFIFGLFAAFYMASMITMLVEITGLQHRLYILLWYLLWELGFCVLSLLAYFTMNWRYLLAVTNLLYFPFIIILCFIYESPRWLIHKGRIEEAQSILLKISKINGQPLQEEDLKILTVFERNQLNEGHDIKWNYLWHNSTILIQLIVLCICSLVTFCVLYIIFLNTGELVGNKYINVACFGLIKVIPIGLIVVADHYCKLGRKSSMCLGYVGAFLCMSSTCILVQMGYSGTLLTLLTVLASCFLLPTMIGSWIYPAELFPTLVRSRAASTVSTFARIGSLMAPSILVISPHSTIVPHAVAALMTLFALILALSKLPETRGQPLMEMPPGSAVNQTDTMQIISDKH